jgi:peptidyl-prolyl cis-trans isomerase SurA
MAMIVFLFIFASSADHIAAYVGQDIILESEVSENISFLQSDRATMEMFTTSDELREYVLDQLISQKLIMIEAENESIVVTDEEVETRVDKRIEEIKERYPSEADFFEDLEHNGISLEELKKYNMDNLKSELTMQRLVQKKLASKVSISPIEIRRFYDENKDSIAHSPDRVKLSHILLAIQADESALRKGFERAAEVYRLLYTGGDFSVIAQEFSDDERSKYKGGMLGKIKRGETLEEFEAAVFQLKPGVVSQPFLTRSGYHIVEVLNKSSDWVLARQILIRVMVTRADTLRYENLAKRLQELVAQGVDFDSLARYYSVDPNIDIGEYYVNQLTPPIDTIVENLEQGELSDPMMTPYGYHQIYVKERIPGKILTFEELRDQIADYLYSQELQENYNEMIDDLKSRIFVKKFLHEELSSNTN